MDKSCPQSDSVSRKGPASEQLPNEIRIFFWDVDPEKLSVVESAHFIISRLMEHGDENALRFLLKHYDRNELVRVLRNSRSISKRSRIFWSLFFGITKESCTPRRYPTVYTDCSNASIDPWN
ncbi:DUF6922 domain-containing protein [Desulfatiglans anilini]|uniref:DUF6922 domain-containing protein n=1 Tax=Desulfatiglans anilini TaxID=90728 RepID=UPI003EB96C32